MNDARGNEEGGPLPPSRPAAPCGGSTAALLYERYSEDHGMELKRFLKFFRDAVLFDNSWTWGVAGSVFFEHAVVDLGAHGAGARHEVRRLSLSMFWECLRCFMRQSTLVRSQAANMIVREAEPEDHQWEALQELIRNRLKGSPKSDGDEVLNKWFLQEPIQMLCLQNEYHLRRVYRALVKSKDPSVRGWVDLCKTDALLEKVRMVKCLRELIPKEFGTLRGDDWSIAMRFGDHENSSHEEGTKDTSRFGWTFPEFVEIIVRCALGTTPFRSAPEPAGRASWYGEFWVDEARGDEDADEAEIKSERSFDPVTDEMHFALMRIRKIWDWLFEWLAKELDGQGHRDNDGSLLMEDSPTYDEVYSDVQMLFANYAANEPLSRTLIPPDPNLRLSLSNLLRLASDSCFLDSRITSTTVSERFRAIPGSDAGIDFFQWQCLMVGLAKTKYKYSASGLQWRKIGAKKDWQGRELDHHQLQMALREQTNFTQQDWDDFGVRDLCMDHFVKSGGFFKPAESAEPEQLRQLRGFAAEMVAGCSLGGLLAATKSPSAAVDTLLKMAKQ